MPDQEVLRKAEREVLRKADQPRSGNQNATPVMKPERSIAEGAFSRAAKEREKLYPRQAGLLPSSRLQKQRQPQHLGRKMIGVTPAWDSYGAS